MGAYLNGEYLGPSYSDEETAARERAALKRMMGQPLNDEDWDALELGPFNGELVLKRPNE
jgi:hypothetical protein